MKNLIKITTICSLLLIAGLLISSCGSGGTENFVQGNGQITVNVTNNAVPAVALANVRIDVRVNTVAGTIVDTGVTDINGTHIFQETVGSDYFLTFTDLNSPARFAARTDPSIVHPLLTATVTVNEVLF